MSVPARQWIAPEEYLALEERAEYKSEYFGGEIFAMAGGSPEHNLVAMNVAGELWKQLSESPCRVYPSDQRVKVPDTGLYTYADVTVVCAEPQYEESRPRSLLNPTLIVEVLSETTEAYDRGDKFAHYQTLPSLREYVLVASDQRRIERYTRQEGGAEWVYGECRAPAGSLALPSIGCVLSLPDVYGKVEFPERERGKRRGPEGGGASSATD
jgi:Uma2 family endonuclease